LGPGLALGFNTIYWKSLQNLAIPFIKLNDIIDWRIFESPLNKVYKNEVKDMSTDQAFI